MEQRAWQDRYGDKLVIGENEAGDRLYPATVGRGEADYDAVQVSMGPDEVRELRDYLTRWLGHADPDPTTPEPEPEVDRTVSLSLHGDPDQVTSLLRQLANQGS